MVPLTLYLHSYHRNNFNCLTLVPCNTTEAPQTRNLSNFENDTKFGGNHKNSFSIIFEYLPAILNIYIYLPTPVLAGKNGRITPVIN